MSSTTTASRRLRASFARPRSTAPSPCSPAKPTSVWPGLALRRARQARPRWAPAPSAPSRPLLTILCRAPRRAGSRPRRRPSAARRAFADSLGGGEQLRRAGPRSPARPPGSGRTRWRRSGSPPPRGPRPRPGRRPCVRRSGADVAHGVDGWRVPPAVTRTRGPSIRPPGLSTPSTVSRMWPGSASRPVPHSPRDASGRCRLNDRHPPRAQQAEVVARGGVLVMWLFIAGATTNGAEQASAALVSRLSAARRKLASVSPRPGAMQERVGAPHQRQNRSGRRWARARPGRRRARDRARTRRPAPALRRRPGTSPGQRASRLVGVWTTRTECPPPVASRTNSTALYGDPAGYADQDANHGLTAYRYRYLIFPAATSSSAI